MYKTLGRSRELGESMICDCQFQPGVDSPEAACGHGSDCINRLTQVECLPEDCRCKTHCQNQRFHNKEYATIEVVKTEKKGYGLRAEEDLPKDTFIYEYVGDVVGDQSFKKRMRDYADEGIQHFYFMMLQKDEFIDATKHGGIARFANHSCNPNCYVAKWTVGRHVRMGIFAKRNILKYEELTFNYNVDRYGHKAQTCYCGEPNCVGFIGGKTQTDISTMDDLYLDALGITDEDDLRELKGTKKKKGKKIDDPDFMPQLRSILLKEVPKVIQAVRQTQSKKVLAKLLTRIKITEDDTALRQIMRLRGFSLMKNILEDYKEDTEILILTLEAMQTWPLIHLNKVQDSQVNVPVRACVDHDNEAVKLPAQKLLEYWDTLETRQRIPKRLKNEDDGADMIDVAAVYCESDEILRSSKRPRFSAQWELPDDEAIARSSMVEDTPELPPSRRSETPPIERVKREQKRLERERIEKEMEILKKSGIDKTENIYAVIEAAKQKAEEEARAAALKKAQAEAAAAKAEARKRRHELRKQRKKEKAEKAAMTEEQKAANKEKRLLKLVAAVVVKCMSKYGKGLDRERMKKHAKELSQIIADKEKKSSTYKEGRLDTLSDEKVAKIKKFSKEYIEKIIYRMKKAQKQATTAPVPDTPASTLTDTPHESETVIEMTVEEAMDLESDSDESMDEDDEGADGLSPVKEKPPDEDSAMDVDIPAVSQAPSDPRRRPPNQS